MTTPKHNTIGLYFLGIDTLHGDALLDDERRALAAARVERARVELKCALLAEYLLRSELQSRISPEDYLNTAGMELGMILLDPGAPAEVVNAAISEWRAAAGYGDGDEAPEFPDGEFGKPFAEPQPEPAEMSQAEINQRMAAHFERLAEVN